MSTEAARTLGEMSPIERIHYGREIVRIEAGALEQVRARLDTSFADATEILLACRGNVVVSGIGKAGLIGRKITATLSSTGTPSHFLHPAEAVHGDLGCIRRGDAAVLLSQSGETEEVVRLLPLIERLRVPMVAITGSGQSALGQSATVTIEMGPLKEACRLGLAPSASTTAMLAIGDALALVTSQLRRFGREDFALLHPGGSLGRQLRKVEDCMRPLDECRLAPESHTVRQVFVSLSRPGRRSGAVMLVDLHGRLSGIFTDSDLARLFEHRRDDALDRPIGELMNASPVTVRHGAMMVDAIAMMAERKISELPVVDAVREPLGMVDITDVVQELPDDEAL